MSKAEKERNMVGRKISGETSENGKDEKHTLK